MSSVYVCHCSLLCATAVPSGCIAAPGGTFLASRPYAAQLRALDALLLFHGLLVRTATANGMAPLQLHLTQSADRQHMTFLFLAAHLAGISPPLTNCNLASRGRSEAADSWQILALKLVDSVLSLGKRVTGA